MSLSLFLFDTLIMGLSMRVLYGGSVSPAHCRTKTMVKVVQYYSWPHCKSIYRHCLLFPVHYFS